MGSARGGTCAPRRQAIKRYTLSCMLFSFNLSRAHWLCDDLRCHGHRARHLYDLGPRGTDPRRRNGRQLPYQDAQKFCTQQGPGFHAIVIGAEVGMSTRARSGAHGARNSSASEAGRLLLVTPNCVFVVDCWKAPERLIGMARFASFENVGLGVSDRKHSSALPASEAHSLVADGPTVPTRRRLSCCKSPVCRSELSSERRRPIRLTRVEGDRGKQQKRKNGSHGLPRTSNGSRWMIDRRRGCRGVACSAPCSRAKMNSIASAKRSAGFASIIRMRT